MSLFSSNEVRRVGEIMGYFPGQMENDKVALPLAQINYIESKKLIFSLISEVKEIEDKIKELHERVLTSKVDEIDLNARTAIREYERLGTKKLQRISQITGIELMYNLFKPQTNYSQIKLP